MELKDTKDLMCSEDYKDRFKAEYWQLKIRHRKLVDMCKKWDKGELSFTPTCPRKIYDAQLYAMERYMEVLEERAELENINMEE